MPVTNEQLAEIQKRVESVPPTALAAELQKNAEALLLQKENPALHFGVGLLYARIGDFASATKMLSTASNLAGNNEIILGALAYLFANHVGDHEIALEYLKKLHKLNKKNPATPLLMANSALHLGKPEDALAFIDKVRKLKAESPQLLFTEAQAFIQLGRREEAKELANTLSKSTDPGETRLAEALHQQLKATARPKK